MVGDEENEVRFQKVELVIADHSRILGEHGRRIDDSHLTLEAHGKILAEHGTHLETQSKLLKALQDNTATQKRMIEVGEAVIEALGWAAKAAKFIACFAGAIAAVIAACKSIKF